MFISSLHFSGPVPPCIRTDTASDYRTTFFKGPEVNVPVFCIIKVITHGAANASLVKGAWTDCRRTVPPSKLHVLWLARFWTFCLVDLRQTTLADHKSDHRPVHGSEYVSDHA